MGDDGGFSGGDTGFSSSGDNGFSSGGDTGFSSSGGDAGFSSSGDTGFSSGGDTGFGSSGGDGCLSKSGAADYSNDSKCYSIDQGDDNHAKWNHGSFVTSNNEPDKTTCIKDDGDDDKSHGLSFIYPALAAASFIKDPLPNENGDAPASLLLSDSRDDDTQEPASGTDCGIIDLLFCLCCCT